MKSPVHLLRIVYTVHTDFYSRGTTCAAFDQEDDAYRHAATIAYANFETQRNFSASHKRRLRHLWQKEDYRGVESLRLYARRTGLTFEADTEAALTDLLADLRHFCDREGLDFEEYMLRALKNYLQEIDGKS